MFYITLFVCSFGFSSLVHYPRFYLGLFLCLHIIGTPFQVLFKFILNSIDLSSLGCHPRYYLSYSFFPLVFIIRTPSLVLSKLNCLFIWFLIIGTHPQILFQFKGSFGFLSLGHIPRFYFNLFFVHLVSHHWKTILGSISVYSLFYLVSHHQDVIIGSI